MLFGGEPKPSDAAGDSSMSDFYKLLISCGCNILQPEETLAGLR
jgi:hypothetical protein